MELTEREVAFLLAWEVNDGKHSPEIGKAAGLSEDATEVIAQNFHAMGLGDLAFGSFRLLPLGRLVIEQVHEALKAKEDEDYKKGL